MDPLTGTHKNWSALNWKKIKNIFKKNTSHCIRELEEQGDKKEQQDPAGLAEHKAMKCENTAKATLEVTIKPCLPGKLCKGSGTPFPNRHPRSAAGEQSRDRKQMEKSAMKGKRFHLPSQPE